MLYFVIKGIPKPKQSFRYSHRPGKDGGKGFVQRYQSKEVKDAEADVKTQVLSQLPEDFVPYDCPLSLKAKFVFPFTKSFSKKKLRQAEAGKIFYKDTKPDITDNLMKGLCDAMEGIVFINDSRVCKVSSEKVYGDTPRIEILIQKIG